MTTKIITSDFPDVQKKGFSAEENLMDRDNRDGVERILRRANRIPEEATCKTTELFGDWSTFSVFRFEFTWYEVTLR